MVEETFNQMAEQEFSRSSAAVDADGAGSLIESTYGLLSSDIIHGKYSPGEKLKLQSLSDNYGVSVGTVRESLSLLVSDGLVLTQAQRGFRVAPMSIGDFRDLTKARVLLESSSLRDSILLGKDDWEGRVVQAYHQLSLAEKRLQADPVTNFGFWELRNQEFHDALVSAADSRWVQRFREVLYKQAERYRRVTTAKRANPGITVHEEHRQIYELVMGRDAEGAVEALSTHIWASFEFMEKSGLLAKNQGTE